MGINLKDSETLKRRFDMLNGDYVQTNLRALLAAPLISLDTVPTVVRLRVVQGGNMAISHVHEGLRQCCVGAR